MSDPTIQTVVRTREALKQRYGADVFADWSDEEVLTFYNHTKAFAETKPDFEQLMPQIRALTWDWSKGPTDPNTRLNWAYRTAKRHRYWQSFSAFFVETLLRFIVLGVVVGPFFVGTVPIEGDGVFNLFGRLIGRWLSAWPVIISAIQESIFDWLGFE